MIFREASIADIPQIQIVRHAVKENRLSNPALVTDANCEDYIMRRGKGWVCIDNDIVVGFSIADRVDHNVWALFVHPDFEKQGIGRRLHDLLLDWYFSQTKETIWLSTDPNTRAFEFYNRVGWKQNGFQKNGEARFEMTFDYYSSKISSNNPCIVEKKVLT